MKNKILIAIKYIIVFMCLTPFIVVALLGFICDLLFEWIKTDDKSIIDIFRELIKAINKIK